VDPQGGVELPIIAGTVPLPSAASVIAPDIFSMYTEKKKKSMDLGKMFWSILSHTIGREEGIRGIDGRVIPRTGVSEWIVLDHHD
jgi:hypothetical protein